MTGDFGSVPSRSTEKENLELGGERAERKLIRENHGFQNALHGQMINLSMICWSISLKLFTRYLITSLNSCILMKYRLIYKKGCNVLFLQNATDKATKTFLSFDRKFLL